MCIRDRDFGELRRLVRLSLMAIAGGALLSFGLSRLLAAPLISLFLPQGGHVYELTHQGFLLFSLSFLLLSLIHIFHGNLLLLGRPVEL